ncbi:MAG: O-antigen ligase family protein [Candidatus Levybacteria bacterium]|nr:O-antigen ligase family protein [Candidatus Levybacteria bacterium]
MKIFKWIGNNLLFIFTVFLLAFIPLYPKIPLLDVQHTWVYIRLEDFAVVTALLTWIFLLLTKKISLKTPLTIPILLFWIAGGVTTLHGVLILFPTIANVFSNVAFLSFLRRLEYISLFFVAYSSIRYKKSITYAAISLAIILLLIVGYGFGQKYLGFPAFLTMNEEFAKGIPIRLSDLSRVPSTFAGQYDLAAYLVLIIPIVTSIAFGFKNLFMKIFLFVAAALGFALLFMTVSRVSFFALLLSMLILLILQKKKIIIFSLLALTAALFIFSPSLLQRFKSTLSEVNVLVNAKTGGAVGEVREVPASYFKDKVIRRIMDTDTKALSATVSATLPFELIPSTAPLVVEANNSSTGESLPQGTSYVNLPLSPIVKKVDAFFSQKLTTHAGVESEEISIVYGDYLIKRARAYDLSFTTRFQGEWPNTFKAFMRNIFIGSGYGSVSLAVDNNYLRILGESGLLGLISFASIFIVAVIYAIKLLPKVDSVVTRSFIFGFLAGSFGLTLNAFLIDVFEASKVAFSYWLLMGITIGTAHLHEKDKIDLLKEFKKVIVSPLAIIIYIFTAIFSMFSPMISNYFVGDDFTWLRWTQNCCGNVVNYFTQADGFFYRPGTKIYFSLMYSGFWLNQTAYHLVSILLHFAVSALLFLVIRKILKDYALSILAVVLFVVLSGHHEDIFWISTTGFLFNALFALAGLLSFIHFREKGKIIYFIISLVFVVFSLLFHELGVVVPLLIIIYDFFFKEKNNPSKLSGNAASLILLLPILPYLVLRFTAQSHWFNGDYSYNIFKLPYNILGNVIGYLLLDLFGPQSLSLYEGLRSFSRDHLLIAIPLSLAGIIGSIILLRVILRKLEEKDRKAVIFGLLFFLVALLPFLGLGNIASRYSYLSSVGFVILLALLLKKASIYLVSISDKYIGWASVSIITVVYLMVQLFALQKIQVDWMSAGRQSQNFLISLERFSKDSWIRQKMQLYFVGQPIRYGEAWVWSVGLRDAVWFTFKNPNIIVNTSADLDGAFDQAKGSVDSHIFKFDKDGNVDEVVRSKDGQVTLLNPSR